MNTGKLVLFDASAVSARDLWAAAAVGLASAPALARWNGTAWSQDRSILGVLPKTTQQGRTVIEAVNAVSDHDVWVAASTSSHGRTTGIVVVHWNGVRWSRVKPKSAGYYLPSAVYDGNGGWWSAPYYATTAFTRYLLHEARGHWSKASLPGSEYTCTVKLARVPRSDVMLATGSNALATGTVLA